MDQQFNQNEYWQIYNTQSTYSSQYQYPTESQLNNPHVYNSPTSFYCNTAQSPFQANYQAPAQYPTYGHNYASSFYSHNYYNPYASSPSNYCNYSNNDSAYQSILINDSSANESIDKQNISPVKFETATFNATNSASTPEQPNNQKESKQQKRKRTTEDNSSVRCERECEMPCKSTERQKRAKIEKLNILIGSSKPECQEISNDLLSNNDSLQFTCQVCSAVLNSAAKLLMHQFKYHKNGTSNQCPVCRKYLILYFYKKKVIKINY